MATVQLRRYELVPDELDAFVAWFPRIVPVREKYGFRVLFAYLDREQNQFVWAVAHDGDFEAALEVYNASPERAAVFADQPKRVAEMHLSYVEPLVG
ncbi:MAG: hypothetical protein GEV08_15510 [Acidimicrobiia bacterium]|nr:hypothetical protein [Acidimicrobiia bacterium]